MSKSSKRTSPSASLYITTLSGLLLWSAVLALSLLWSIHLEHRQVATLVENEARAHFKKDQAFRFWASSHGGVYVPISEETPPNPKLQHIQERDLITPSGRKLTLMNPAYMIRQMMEQYEELYSVKGRITSLKPFNVINTPDAWEKKALLAFEQGVQEVMEYTDIGGKPYLRLMRPMVTKRSCLKCHDYQGYKEGDIRGGVGIALPLATYQKVSGEAVRHIWFTHILLWLLMLPVIFFFFRKARFRMKERAFNELEMEKWFRIFQHAEWGITVIESEHATLETMNSSFAALHNFSLEELRGKPYLSLVDEAFRDDIGQHLTNAQKPTKHTHT
ncbi:MAG: DUF3365 domain-containing protein, partial [Candidatus Electrothrix sp. ATG1]|nr:DUF3365 domain-containing protein [Candidatus Electrothrix sp. ATG1]